MNRPITLAASLLLASGAVAQCLNIGAATTTTLTGSPVAVALADFNGDGRVDLITANSQANTISVCLGNGNGTFGAPTSISVGAGPSYIGVADLNGNGRRDIVVVNSDSNSVIIYTGNGNGTFTIGQTYSTFGSPQQVALADFNGDGRPDMAIACSSGTDLIVRLNNGNGTFGAATNYPVGSSARGVAAADFNGDGRLDLAVSRGSLAGVNNGVVILLGNGNGTFQSGVNTGAGGGTWMQIADLNNDSHPDLIVTNVTDHAVYVQLGRGNGTFRPVISTPAAGQAGSGWTSAVGDIDGDGIPDLAISLGDIGKVGVRLGNGNGTFGSQTDFVSGAKVYVNAMADLDGNGKLDIVSVSNSVNTYSVLLNASLPQTMIQSQPASTSADLLQTVNLNVTASGASSYHWRRNGVDIANGAHYSGVTTQALTISTLSPLEEGDYTCFAAGACSTAISNPAHVSITPQCPADFNHDGTIDFFDYLDFVDALSAGC